MKSLVTVFLKSIDFFLGARNRVSVEARMRARMLVVYFLVWAIINGLTLLSAKLLSGGELAIVLFNFAMCVTTPLLIRMSYSPDKIILSVLCLVLIMQGFLIETSESMNISLMFGFIYITWSAGMLSANMKLSACALLLNVIATYVGYISLSKKGDAYFSSLSPDEGYAAIVHLMSTAAFYSLVFLVLLKIKKIAQKELDQEIEWQQRVQRLDEASSMTKMMRFLLSRPVSLFQHDLKNLERKADGLFLDKMQARVDELVLISQSFAWIYRAHGGGGSYSVLSDTLMRHLEVLLSFKMQEEGWTFGVEHRGRPVEIFGPVPSIVLFLFTVINQILEEPQPLQDRHLSLEFDHEGDRATWKLHWPYCALENSSEHDIPKGDGPFKQTARQELIRDLSQLCRAKIQYSREQNSRQILITGSWQRFA